MINTKERPIILTAQEVNAVLAGDKTQHRVIIENTESTQCLFNGDWRYDGRDFLDNDGYIPDPKGAHYIERLNQDGLPTEDYRCIGHCPFGAIGDRLWVQEDHARQRRWEEKFSLTGAHYFADGPLTLDVRHDAGMLEKHSASNMPRWASRLLLEITDIRIERVQDITLGDSLKEARDGLMDFAADYWMPKHGEAAWFKNPWVWAIEFKVIHGVTDD